VPPQRRSRRTPVSQLGPVDPVEPADHDVDGGPVLGPDQVYVTRTGEVFHPIRCEIVAQLLAQKKSVLVILDSTVGGRRECQVCATEMSPGWND
jgi:hypothetical protein